MTAREYFAILESVIKGARDHGILRQEATADGLLPAERLEWLSSATATIYIQAQRRTGVAPWPAPPAVAGTSSPPATDGSPASPPKVPPESQGTLPREVDTHGEYVYHKCPKCGQVKPYKKWWPGAKCWDCYKGAKP